MRLSLRLALAAALLAASAPAPAATVRNLFEAGVPVADQSPGSREAALRQALEAVLVRVTGTRALPPEALGLLPRAAALVQGYGYEAGSGKDLLLRAQFDARAVEAALRRQGLPVWGANRPSHLVWLAMRDDDQPRAIVDAAAAATRAGALLAAAEARGLPLVLPEMDATERRLVSFNELWSGRVEGAAGTARRYGADVVVIGRVGREGGRWIGRWTFLDGSGASEEWVGTHATAADALTAGIHELADREAQRFAVQTGHVQELRLQVAGVASLAEYGRVLNYLRSRTAVRSAQVEAVQGNRTTFRLRVEGDPQTLSRAIASGNVLRERESGLFGPAWSYELVR
jgi:uncharacterized protein